MHSACVSSKRASLFGVALLTFEWRRCCVYYLRSSTNEMFSIFIAFISLHFFFRTKRLYLNLLIICLARLPVLGTYSDCKTAEKKSLNTRLAFVFIYLKRKPVYQWRRIEDLHLTIQNAEIAVMTLMANN